MKKIGVYFLVLVVISMLLFNGCTTKDASLEQEKAAGEKLVCLPEETPQENTDIVGKVTEEIKEGIPDVLEEEVEEPEVTEVVEEATTEELTGTEDTIVKTYTEGDLVKLIPKATDKDNDEVTFTFTDPLNNNGEWQTKVGDAGTYYITVTADDGKTSVSKKVKLIIVPQNNVPTLTIESIVAVNEGDKVQLSPVTSDIDGDDVSVSFSGWMTSATKQTSYNDAGEYTVSVTASDGIQSVSKEVTVKVKNVNRPPVLNNIEDVVVIEGDTVAVTVKALDADQDEVTYSFLGAPLDKQGKWVTKEGDAGTYMVKAIADDGTDKAEKQFLVVVKLKNKAPVITPISDILLTVEKGKTKTVKLEPKVVDEDGDEVTITYSGWMTSATKIVGYEEGGKHVVTITANDGKQKTSIDVNIEINRPPEFVIE